MVLVTMLLVTVLVREVVDADCGRVADMSVQSWCNYGVGEALLVVYGRHFAVSGRLLQKS